jgi:hypothetical protein
MTKDRVGAALAVAAAVVGLVLVFTGRGDAGDAGPAAPPATSRVAPAPGGQVAPPASGQDQEQAPAQPDDD